MIPEEGTFEEMRSGIYRFYEGMLPKAGQLWEVVVDGREYTMVIASVETETEYRVKSFNTCVIDLSVTSTTASALAWVDMCMKGALKSTTVKRTLFKAICGHDPGTRYSISDSR